MDSAAALKYNSCGLQSSLGGGGVCELVCECTLRYSFFMVIEIDRSDMTKSYVFIASISLN